jgi:large subunit ribosomal protein L15
MKLHDLSPAPGSRTARTRVGRGIAAGKGKTAGRGTKGQKARTGHGALPARFEGGQTPIHVRIPKLRGFRNMFRIEYEIVNVGRINALADTGILDAPEIDGAAKKSKPAPVTVTPDILAAAGLVSTLDKPLKILGMGEVTRPLFIIADAFTKSAKEKIEAAGGTAQVLEFPSEAVEEEAETVIVPAKATAPAKAAKPAAKVEIPAPATEEATPTSTADEAGSEA